jgi:hypothetical protein
VLGATCVPLLLANLGDAGVGDETDRLTSSALEVVS